MSTARFKLRNQTTDGAWSPFTNGDFDAAAGDVIEAKLEDAPALDIWQTRISCIDRSAGRTQVTLDPADGTLTAPDHSQIDIVTITIPAAEVGTWEIQCQVNGGVAVIDAAGRPDKTINTATRMLVVRTANLDLRHPLADDLAKDPERAAVALQEMLDAVDAGTGGGGGDPKHYQWYRAQSDVCETDVASVVDDGIAVDVPLGQDGAHVLQVVYPSGWTGGSLHITGTTWGGGFVSDNFVFAGAGTVTGTQVFTAGGTVTVTNSTPGSGTHTAKVQYRRALCLPTRPVTALRYVVIDSVTDSGAALLDADRGTVIPSASIGLSAVVVGYEA